MTLPTCAFCGRSGAGVQFQIFAPRFEPFGTACVECEAIADPAALLEVKHAADAARREKQRARDAREAAAWEGAS